MSLFQDENNSIISDDDMEPDAQVKVEETFVNLDCIKKEEPDFEGISNINPFEIKIKFEDDFEENSEENSGCGSNLNGMLDDDVKIEEGIVKLENIKGEEMDSIITDVKQFSCNKCAGNYEGYCPNCSSLSHILSNNVILDINTELDLNTIPKNILEIRDVSKEKKVFALKALQKGVIFGPFDGVSPIECTTGFVWKIKEWKFVTQECGNWMKHVACAANRFCRNMDILQRNSDIYFQTSRKIKVGEELLIHYSDEVMLALDNREECYFTPERKRSSSKIFACSACYLGFRLESCLVEHKSKCPFGDQGRSNEDFEIVKCSSCKMWLEKQEHLGRHMPQCLENYKRNRKSSPRFQQMEDVVGEIRGNNEPSTIIDENTDSVDTIITNSTEGQDAYSLYFDVPNLQQMKEDKVGEIHGNNDTSTIIGGNANDSADTIIANTTETHNEYADLPDGDDNETNIYSNTIGNYYGCQKCFYQTNDSQNFKSHINAHNGIKRYQCDICKTKYHHEHYLQHHMKKKHSNRNGKKYKCRECIYETDYKKYFEGHVSKYHNIKPFQCHLCDKKYSCKGSLSTHIQFNHTNNTRKLKYSCLECSFQTNNNRILKTHHRKHLENFKMMCYRHIL